MINWFKSLIYRIKEKIHNSHAGIEEGWSAWIVEEKKLVYRYFSKRKDIPKDAQGVTKALCYRGKR